MKNVRKNGGINFLKIRSEKLNWNYGRFGKKWSDFLFCLVKRFE